MSKAKGLIIIFSIFIYITCCASNSSKIIFLENEPETGMPIKTYPLIGMGEYMITNLTEHKFIFTAFLNTCFGMILYDPVTKLTVLTHVPPGIKNLKGSINMFLREFNKHQIPFNRIRAKLIGGATVTSSDQIYAIENILSKNGILVVRHNIHFYEELFGQEAGKISLGKHGLIFNLEDGSFVTFGSHIMFSFNNNLKGYSSAERLSKTAGAYINQIALLPE